MLGLIDWFKKRASQVLFQVVFLRSSHGMFTLSMDVSTSASCLLMRNCITEWWMWPSACKCKYAIVGLCHQYWFALPFMTNSFHAHCGWKLHPKPKTLGCSLLVFNQIRKTYTLTKQTELWQVMLYQKDGSNRQHQKSVVWKFT